MSIKQNFINDLSSYLPLGRQVVLEMIQQEGETKSGLSLGAQSRWVIVKIGPEVENIKTKDYVVLQENCPICVLTTGAKTYHQIDSAYIIGTEILQISNK